jgi:hypothetical protein
MVNRIAFFTESSLRNLQNGLSLARIGIQKDINGRSVMEKPVDRLEISLPSELNWPVLADLPFRVLNPTRRS